MVNIEIPKVLPECELLRVLANKASQRIDIDFNFFGRLDEFRQRVSAEVRQINELFPEYTPHDEQYHLNRLYHVADTILGKDRLEEINSAELFVLAVSLYGHDWGMAVNNPEKQYIISGKPPEGTKIEDLGILPDERDRFTKFIRTQGVKLDITKAMTEIPIELWREYVRQTHAFRSGERVRRFFDPIDGGVAEAASRVCIGHWLDFEDLQDYRSYPTDFSVLRETVNLRALAVYLRLIDLLDLAEDRTPYVIWKFVAPRDPRSKMEWAKHRALRPVTCPQYQLGRVILVDGSTDDHAVYVALEDLRIWCQEQLRGCNDVLARMNDPRHLLNLYHIDWRVAARGFKPISIQFEFDRERMFQILGDEIYQSDLYVFLRELLQNSIDAIRMRREVLRRKGIDPGNLGVIHVIVEHNENGDAIVTWRDDGIGMDEYIMRNYLAVAGKSYYRSTDFEREGLKMDPISRFGIGILSCFMVTDRIEIETFKDPYLPPQGEPLRIIIPAMRRQFRIEIGNRELAEIGTTVRVFIDGKKLPVEKEGKPVKPLDVTAYLSSVAGFVEFPIVITEGSRKTIILHPKQDAHAAKLRFGATYDVQQLDLVYPWSEIFLPQDLHIAREFLREESWDIASCSGLGDYDGILAYLAPKNQSIDIIRGGMDISVSFTIQGRKINNEEIIRWDPKWSYYSAEVDGISHSSKHSLYYSVYRDGILLSKATSPSFLERDLLNKYVPVARLLINLPKSKIPRVDLARTQTLDQTERWDSQFSKAYQRHVIEKSLKGLLSLEPAKRWYQIGRLIAFYNIHLESLWQNFPHDHWPIPFLEKDKGLTVLEWQEVKTHTVFYLTPELLHNEELNCYLCRWITLEKYSGILIHWAGEKCISAAEGRPDRQTVPGGITQASKLWQFPLNELYSFAAIRFLEGPLDGLPPLLQKILLPITVPELPADIETVLKKAIDDPMLLNHYERELLKKDIRSSIITTFPVTVEFPQPFEHSFAYGEEFFNLKHPFTQTLLRILAALLLTKRHKKLSSDRVGELEDALRYPFRIFGFNLERWSEALPQIYSLVRELRIVEAEKLKEIIPDENDFVPGTLNIDSERLQKELELMERPRPFGRSLV